MFFAKLPALLFASDASTTRDGLMHALEQDTYYCYLVPLTIPVSILAFYANWVSLKFFRHN
jgi:phosphatidylinositol N-acetylglucosaminyltransferase subunit Y